MKWLSVLVCGAAVGAAADARGAGLPVVDSCVESAYLDRTAVGADREFDWDFPFAGSPERCITIRAGQSVHWIGLFAAHPLENDQGTTPNPISNHDAAGVVLFTQPGIYGYRCNYHFEMRGAIQVLPAPPAIPWGTRPALSALALLLVASGLRFKARRGTPSAPRAGGRPAT